MASPAGPLRVLTAELTSDGQPFAQATVLGPLSPGEAQARGAFVRIGVASAVGLLLGGLVLLIALRRALRPVHDLATAARSVDLNDLSSRVPEPVTDDEVAGMAREFNRMLDRISDDERHRQQLLSAISHELRTPLAVARGHLELLETLGPSDGHSAAETAGVVRRELDRLGRIVDDLTAINEGEAGADTVARAGVRSRRHRRPPGPARRPATSPTSRSGRHHRSCCSATRTGSPRPWSTLW